MGTNETKTHLQRRGVGYPEGAEGVAGWDVGSPEQVSEEGRLELKEQANQFNIPVWFPAGRKCPSRP